MIVSLVKTESCEISIALSGCPSPSWQAHMLLTAVRFQTSHNQHFEGQPVSEEEIDINLPCINMKFKMISNLKLSAKCLSYCGHLSNCFLFLGECNVKTEK